MKKIILKVLEDYYSQNNRCIENSKVFSDDGSFIPYSIIINTIEQHKFLCSFEHNSNEGLAVALEKELNKYVQELVEDIVLGERK